MTRLSMSRIHVRHALKTGLACGLSYIVSTYLKSDYPVWAVISTIVVMQRTSVAESLQASLLRFSGMAIGAIVGVSLSFVFVHPENIWQIAMILFGLNAAGAYFFQYGARYMLASIAATIVLLVGHIQMRSTMPEALEFGFTLIWEIALGVGIATLVSMLIWPIRLSDTLKKEIERQFSLVADHLLHIASAYQDNRTIPTSELMDLVPQLLRNRERLTAAAEHEKYLYNENYKEIDARTIVINRTVTVLRILLDVLDDGTPMAEPAPFPERVKEIADLLASIMLEYGHAGSSTLHGLQERVKKAVILSRDSMAELTPEVGGRGPSFHCLMCAHSFFRLLSQLGGLYEAETCGNCATAFPVQMSECFAASQSTMIPVVVVRVAPTRVYPIIGY